MAYYHAVGKPSGPTLPHGFTTEPGPTGIALYLRKPCFTPWGTKPVVTVNDRPGPAAWASVHIPAPPGHNRLAVSTLRFGMKYGTERIFVPVVEGYRTLVYYNSPGKPGALAPAGASLGPFPAPAPGMPNAWMAAAMLLVITVATVVILFA